MAVKFSITADKSSFNLISDFSSSFRTEIIEKGFDITLTRSLQELKAKLKFVVNDQIRMDPPKSITEENKSQQVENGLGQPMASAPKSDAEILKHLTNGKTDLSKYNAAKDYTTLHESGVVFGHESRGQEVANRVTLRLDIAPGETVQTQFEKAKRFFHEAIFALPDKNGKIHYYKNPGIDLSKFIKIKCSVFTGAESKQKSKKGMTPEERFERNSQTKGHADWTLKQEAVEAIKKSFIDITDTMDALKDGDHDKARALLNGSGKVIPDELHDQINKLEHRKDLMHSTQNYVSALDLIKNLRLMKKIYPENVVYSLISEYENTEGKKEVINFSEAIERSIRGWITEYYPEWLGQFSKVLEKLINTFESG